METYENVNWLSSIKTHFMNGLTAVIIWGILLFSACLMLMFTIGSSSRSSGEPCS